MVKRIFKPLLNEVQDHINREYEKQGATDELLDAQIIVNKIRNKLDLHDETEEIYDGFVQ